ncbi:hypothetical protein Halha_2284 [Halobacteroides halobius DSM 5150]|uniref:Uncharacterized protein n=1 Tax=Halobacteroides halobius (strain ATCC 35273 / DSM 5150 / MD-1) TaxID=748449 RepID=L0KDJ3_HALHC|nr:hypothetical protein [Halobacteroides halobius]AGB42158.1 hypothetical protein Halha_2284 [Halobacteroides halobius DSM 5150]
MDDNKLKLIESNLLAGLVVILVVVIYTVIGGKLDSLLAKLI